MKILKALWKGFKLFWIWFAMYVVGMIILSLLEQRSIIDENTCEILLGVWFFTSITIVVFTPGFKTRCPRCKRLWAIKYYTKNVTGTQKIKMTARREIKNDRGIETTYYIDMPVDGTRTSYDEVYRCKYCAHKIYHSFYEDIADY